MLEHVEPKPKTVKIPGPDHPISVERNASRVVVTVGRPYVADTREALTLREASYPPVQYIPRKDVDMTLLARTDHATYCPYKGDRAYYSIPLGGVRSTNAVWTYETPYAAVAAIRDYPPSIQTASTRSRRGRAANHDLPGAERHPPPLAAGGVRRAGRRLHCLPQRPLTELDV